MFNTTKQMKLEGAGPEVNVRFNPSRLKEVRKEVNGPDYWKFFRWRNLADEIGRAGRVNAANQIMFMLEVAHQDSVLTTDTTDTVFTMIHQMLVERNILDSDWEMRLPVITLLD